MVTEQWQKSTRSGAEGNCVECRKVGDVIEVRHSQHPDGAVITYTQAEWDAFLQGAKAGEFDL